LRKESTKNSPWSKRRGHQSNDTLKSSKTPLHLIRSTKPTLKIGNNSKVSWLGQSGHSPGVRTPVTLIYHHIDYVNTNLSVGHYFFKDILNEGILLYDTKRFELAEPRILRPEEYKEQAQEYFEEWFESASDFFKTYEFNLSQGTYKLAAFQLHHIKSIEILLAFDNPLDYLYSCIIPL
jgi:hypothetical protein